MPIGWVNYNINISLKNKYVYIENPKCACTTIKQTLIAHELGELTQKYKATIHGDLTNSIFVKPFQLTDVQLEEILTGDEFFKFAFVRNPYTRSLSAYLDKALGPKPGYEYFFEQSGKTKEQLTYLDFLNVLNNISCYDMNSHFRPQYYQLFGSSIGLDFIGRFETFHQDFSQVMEKINCEVLLNYQKHKTAASDLIQQYLGVDERNLALQLYAEDFSTFNYPTTI
jgi:hypothetical protein